MVTDHASRKKSEEEEEIKLKDSPSGNLLQQVPSPPLFNKKVTFADMAHSHQVKLPFSF